jgi:hypothetical protein
MQSHTNDVSRFSAITDGVMCSSTSVASKLPRDSAISISFAITDFGASATNSLGGRKRTTSAGAISSLSRARATMLVNHWRADGLRAPPLRDRPPRSAASFRQRHMTAGFRCSASSDGGALSSTCAGENVPICSARASRSLMTAGGSWVTSTSGLA